MMTADRLIVPITTSCVGTSRTKKKRITKNPTAIVLLANTSAKRTGPIILDRMRTKHLVRKVMGLNRLTTPSHTTANRKVRNHTDLSLMAKEAIRAVMSMR